MAVFGIVDHRDLPSRTVLLLRQKGGPRENRGLFYLRIRGNSANHRGGDGSLRSLLKDDVPVDVRPCLGNLANDPIMLGHGRASQPIVGMGDVLYYPGKYSVVFVFAMCVVNWHVPSLFLVIQ